MTLRNSEEQLKKHFEALAGERLPLWEDIPDLELYMDQVVSIVTDGLLPFNITESDIVLTPSMVNNYVKKKVMPAPVKKRYKRTHIAYLFIILIAKSELQLKEINYLVERILADINSTSSDQDSDQEIKKLYRTFHDMHSQALEAVFSSSKDSHTIIATINASEPSTRALFWICLTSCARLRSIAQVQQLAEKE